MRFFQRVLVQNWSFLHVFILDEIGQENVFYDILEGRNAFLGSKNKKLKKLKNWDFSKGVSPLFLVENWSFLHVFILGILGLENVFHDIVEGKNAFLGYKNKMFKNSKIWGFFKGGSPWFWSKIGHFCMFLF